MENLRGVAYLRAQLRDKKKRVDMRYRFYEQKFRARDFGISTPPKLRDFSTVLGWCTRAVNGVADRIQFSRFENDFFNIGEIYDQNNADILFSSAVLSALISSCCFIHIEEGDQAPRMMVVDGGNATGTIDPVTGLLKEGYAVLERDKKGNPTREAYYTDEYTEFYENGYVEQVPHSAGYCLLVPIVFRPDAKRPFGHSVISRACIDNIQGAVRTLKRAEVSAEFYSFPQKYIVGLSQDAEISSAWNAAMSSMLSIEKDEDGDSPKLGQFTQQSMTPHIDQFKMYAAVFAGETGLTLDDLGFPSDNPSSAESIKAAHETLRLIVRAAQRDLSVGFKNAGFVAACLRDGSSWNRYELRNTSIVFEPIFEPDAAMLSSIGDGAIKINQAVPGYFGSENLEKLTGIESN